MTDQPQSSRPPLTPAQRVIGLSREVAFLRDQLAAAQAALRAIPPHRPLARYHTFEGTSFGGISMAQYWCDLVLWEAVLNDNPQLTAVLEIGTWLGGLSWWLDAQCRARGMAFRTFDAVVPRPLRPPNFHRVDVFAEADRIIGMLADWGAVALFCDGGNKPREMQTFAPHLQAGSVLLVHDWGTETQPADVPDSLVMVYGDYCDELGGITRVFKPRLQS